MTTQNTARARSAIELAERRVEREKRGRAWSLTVRNSLERHDISKKDAAEAAGIKSASILSRQLDPDNQDAVSISDIAGMDLRVVRDCARELAMLVGCDLAEMPRSLDALGGLKAAARLQREAAEAVLATITALEDGMITRAEAAPLIKELDDLIGASLAIRAWCQRALIEGAVNVGGDT